MCDKVGYPSVKKAKTAITTIKKNSHNYILMEKEEKYFNIINERILGNVDLFNAS